MSVSEYHNSPGEECPELEGGEEKNAHSREEA